jgi:heme/copper-type cytochrome/quinol oxidase subunit 1
MPRRIPDFPDAFAHWNYISSFGSVISIISSLFFFYFVAQALSHSKQEDKFSSLITLIDKAVVIKK